MTTLGALERWRSDGTITGTQHSELTAIVRKERFSIFLELNALLYLGVLSFIAGLGWTVYDHFAQLGDAAIVLPLAVAFAGSLYYCFARAAPYDRDAVDSPSLAFDYVLLFGCLVFGVELGYIEYRFQWLRTNWDYYLLASAILYFVLAYRFDNRFVLSLALSTLAGWFGVRLTLLNFHIGGSLRGDALAYAALTGVTGWLTSRSGIKRHFLEAYLHVAINVGLAALVSGVDGREHAWLWAVAAIVMSALTIAFGVRSQRFVFVVYGVLYGYVAFSAQVTRSVADATVVFAYYTASGIAVLIALAILSRRLAHPS